MLRNISVKAKLNLILFSAVGAIGIVYAVLWYSNSIVSELKEAEQLVDIIDKDVLDLRKSEKDFFARNDLKYSQEFTGNFKTAKSDSARLAAILNKRGVSTEKLKQLEAVLENYKKDFFGIVIIQQKIGLNEKEGFYGALRDSAHQAEQTLQDKNDYKLLAGLNKLRRHEKDFMLRSSLDYVDKFKTGYDAFKKDLLAGGISDEEKRKILESMEAYKSDFLNLVEGSKEIGLSYKEGLQGVLRDTIHSTETMLGELKEELAKTIKNKIVVNTTVSLSIVVLFVLFIIVLIKLISDMLLKSFLQAMNVSEQLTGGDLTIDIEITSRDEAGRMLASMKEMAGNLQRIVYQTKESSFQVSSTADQLSEANQSFSQKITEQAASIEETSATMEEMSSSIKQIAQNTIEALKLAKSTKEQAQEGSEVMGDTIKAMDDITRSSLKIADISNVIEEIAFQTNLLALNAAVEAARAGEHGKGFAVVASEIRSLAQRTKQSTKEIIVLIEDSSMKIGNGVNLARQLNVKLDNIVMSVKKVADLMDDISAASNEQASGSNQINIALSQLEQTIQQNTALVEETSVAAEELAAQARELTNLISFFKVKAQESTADTQRGAVRVQPAPARAREITHQGVIN